MFGLFPMSFWGYVLVLLGMTHITIISVTVYLHRAQAHRAIDLHPVVAHFFRFWLWLTTGMVTKEWVAIHRKHHAYVEGQGDPHSPVVEGIDKVFWEGTELYRHASRDGSITEQYGYGTPDDVLENKLYNRHQTLGIITMLVVDVVLFGLPGLTIWALQMAWIPFFAAGVINGIGHYWGYRNFETKDASTNIVPFGILIGGEELHNNHHAYASSAKFSYNWWEIDVSWLYIKLLSFFGLVKIKKLPPKLAKVPNKSIVDSQTLQAVLSSRFQVLSQFRVHVVEPLLTTAFQSSENSKSIPYSKRKLSKLFIRDKSRLTKKSAETLEIILKSNEFLSQLYQYVQQLKSIWESNQSDHNDKLMTLKNWCKKAEESGIKQLEAFSAILKQTSLVPAAA